MSHSTVSRFFWETHFSPLWERKGHALADVAVSALLLRKTLPSLVLDDVYEAATAWFATIAELTKTYGPWGVSAQLPSHFRYLPTVSSLALEPIFSIQTLLDALPLRLYRAVEAYLGRSFGCLSGLSWLRYQAPEGQRFSGSSPHSWHQDGAYGFDFLQGDSQAEDAILPMVTIWIPISPCGQDAPGLELVCNAPRILLGLDALQDDKISMTWPHSHRWRPSMLAGDALLMLGHCIHRTFCTPAMQQGRISLELRFVPASPAPSRLQGEPLVFPVITEPR